MAIIMMRRAATWREDVRRTRILALEAMDELKRALREEPAHSSISFISAICLRVWQANARLEALWEHVPCGSEHSKAAIASQQMLRNYRARLSGQPLRLRAARGTR